MGSIMKNLKLSTLLIAVTAILFVVIVPMVFSGYSLMVFNNSLIYGIIVFGISIMLGMGGQLSFAGLAFMGFGGYFVANVTTGRLGFTLPPFLALVLAPLFTAVLAYGLGLILLKLKGTYFTFSTIALVQVAYSFFNNYRPLFGGPDGISAIPSLSVLGYTFPNKDYRPWFFLLVTIIAILALVVERIRRTGFGRSLASVRDNETAALTLGVDVYMTKVKAFALAGLLGGLAGALYVQMGNFISSDLFAYSNATQFIIMAMVGGINSTFGSVVGSVLITILPEVFRSLEKLLQLIYGLVVILMMVFMPMGLGGLANQLFKNQRRKKKAAASKTPAEGR